MNTWRKEKQSLLNITANYLLKRFYAAIKAKWPHLACKRILFHQNNAWVYKAVKTITKLTKLKYELLSNPLYSLDLAPCDYYLFPNLKRWLARDFTQMKRSLPKQTRVLRSWTPTASKEASSFLKLAEISVSSWKGTMLKNRWKFLRKMLFY